MFQRQISRGPLITIGLYASITLISHPSGFILLTKLFRVRPSWLIVDIMPNNVKLKMVSPPINRYATRQYQCNIKPVVKPGNADFREDLGQREEPVDGADVGCDEQQRTDEHRTISVETHVARWDVDCRKAVRVTLEGTSDISFHLIFTSFY